MTEENPIDKTQMQLIPASHGIIEIYANVVTLQWSLDDVRVRVAQMINSKETPNPGDELIPIAEKEQP